MRHTGVSEERVIVLVHALVHLAELLLLQRLLVDGLLAGFLELLSLLLESGGHLALLRLVKREGADLNTFMWLLGRVCDILVEGRGHLSLWELAPVVGLGAAEVSLLLDGILTGHERVNGLARLVPGLLLGVEDLLDALRELLLLAQLLVDLAPGGTLEQLLGEAELGLLGATLVGVLGDRGRLVRAGVLVQGPLLLALLAGLACEPLGARGVVVDCGVGVSKDTLLCWSTALLDDSVKAQISLFAVLLGERAASDLAEVVLHLQSLLLFLLALYLLLLVVLEHDFNFVFVQEGDRLVQDVQVHLDDLGLAHELQVGGLLLALCGLWLLAKAGILEDDLRAFVQPLKLESVLASKILEVFGVLNVDLVQNLLEVLSLDSLHVVLELLDLLWDQSGLQLVQFGAFLGLVDAQHDRNLLTLLSFEVLINSMLHRVDPLLESGVPVVLHSVVSAAHQLLADETPLLVALVAENEEHPLLLLRPFSPLDLWVEVIEPSLSTRLSGPAVEGVRQVAPHHMLVALAFLVDILEDNLVLDNGPVTNRVGRGFLKLCVHSIAWFCRVNYYIESGVK